MFPSRACKVTQPEFTRWQCWKVCARVVAAYQWELPLMALSLLFTWTSYLQSGIHSAAAQTPEYAQIMGLP